MAPSLAVLSTPVVAEDGAKVSFTFDLHPVKISITGVNQDDLHEDQMKEMLKRTAQLAHYSVLKLKQQNDFRNVLKAGRERLDNQFGPRRVCDRKSDEVPPKARSKN